MSRVRTPESQVDTFRRVAREIECDDDPEHFKERLGKLVKHKPVEKEKD